MAAVSMENNLCKSSLSGETAWIARLKECQIVSAWMTAEKEGCWAVYLGFNFMQVIFEPQDEKGSPRDPA